jgi:hypothetical protein
MVLENISYFNIAGIPFIVYLGAVALVFMLMAGFFGYNSLKNPGKYKFKWHYRFAMISLIFAVLHGGMALLTYI